MLSCCILSTLQGILFSPYDEDKVHWDACSNLRASPVTAASSAALCIVLSRVIRGIAAPNQLFVELTSRSVGAPIQHLFASTQSTNYGSANIYSFLECLATIAPRNFGPAVKKGGGFVLTLTRPTGFWISGATTHSVGFIHTGLEIIPSKCTKFTFTR